MAFGYIRLELPYLVLTCGEYGSTEISVELSFELGVLISPQQIDKHVMRFQQGQTPLRCSRVLDKRSDLAIAITVRDAVRP